MHVAAHEVFELGKCCAPCWAYAGRAVAACRGLVADGRPGHTDERDTPKVVACYLPIAPWQRHAVGARITQGGHTLSRYTSTGTDSPILPRRRAHQGGAALAAHGPARRFHALPGARRHPRRRRARLNGRPVCGFARAIAVSDGLCGRAEVVRFGVTLL